MGHLRQLLKRWSSCFDPLVLSEVEAWQQRDSPRSVGRLACFVVTLLTVPAGLAGPPTWANASDQSVLILGNQPPRGRPRLAAPQVVCGDADLTGLKTVVYVAPQGSDSGSCGQTAAGACKTIQQGIHNCGASGCGVLVRYGLYPLGATTKLRDGVSVYGSCVFDGTTGRPYRTVVQAPSGGTPAISAEQIDTATTLYGFTVLGSDATTPGQASIAMTVSNSTGLTMLYTRLVSGKGADGANGTTPQATRGYNGHDVTMSYSTNSWSGTGGHGGPGCGGSTVGAGGKGADQRFVDSTGCVFQCNCNMSGGDSGAGGQAGDGGVSGGHGGGHGGNGDRCTDGSGAAGQGGTGGTGSPGMCSTQGGSVNTNSWGSFNNASWMPLSGGTGGPGGIGGGGGGGGAGGVCVRRLPNFTWRDYFGLPGGGGGGGGCGGPGGTGGKQGGASIPLVLFNATVARDGNLNSIIPGPGGHGGTGGNGSTGGSGGSGGRSVSTQDYTVCGSSIGDGNENGLGGGGGFGGPGGQGGAGGGGAGGNGGPSIGIAFVGTSLPPPNSHGIYAGQPGAGGAKGRGGQNAADQCRGADGIDGVAGGSAPFGGNIMAAGEQLVQGQSKWSSDGQYQFTLQTDGNLVLYRANPRTALWSKSYKAYRAIMQTDGNFVLYDANGHAPWSTWTLNHPGAYLKVQDDGNVVIYDGQTSVKTLNEL